MARGVLSLSAQRETRELIILMGLITREPTGDWAAENEAGGYHDGSAKKQEASDFVKGQSEDRKCEGVVVSFGWRSNGIDLTFLNLFYVAYIPYIIHSECKGKERKNAEVDRAILNLKCDDQPSTSLDEASLPNNANPGE